MRCGNLNQLSAISGLIFNIPEQWDNIVSRSCYRVFSETSFSVTHSLQIYSNSLINDVYDFISVRKRAWQFYILVL